MSLLISNGQSPVGLPPGGVNNEVLSIQSSSPAWTVFSTLLDNLFGTAQGSVIYRDAALWQGLAPGLAGQALTSQGPGMNPTWVAGGKPSAGNWGVTTSTLTGADLTLTDASDVIQVVAASAFNKVNLPTPTGSSPVFVIINRGLSSLIVQFGGEAVRTLAVDQLCVCYPNPTLTSWYITAAQNVQQTTYYSMFGYWTGGGGAVPIGSFVYAGGAQNSNASLSPRGEFISSATCTLDVAVLDATALVGGNYAIYKNGAITSGPNGAGVGTLSIFPLGGVSLVPGDRVGIQNSSSSAGIVNLLALRARHAASPGYKMIFAGQVSPGPFSYLAPHGPYSLVSTIPTERLPRAMTLSSVTWGAAASSGTFGIYKNGVLATSFVMSATQGLLAVGPVAYAAGDTISINQTAGVGAGDTHVEPIFTGAGSAFIAYSVDHNQGSGAFCVMKGTSRTSFVALRSGSPVRVAAAATGFSGTQNMEFYKNGVATGVTFSIGGVGTATIAPVQYTAGDVIAIRMNTQTGTVSGGVLDVEWGFAA